MAGRDPPGVARFDAYGKIGLGFESPFPRASVEPFGHRFMPTMYGCQTRYAADADPWGKSRTLGQGAIRSLPEVDTKLGGDLLFEFHDAFRECAMRSS